VSGDFAGPTSRTVFTVTARRGESRAGLRARVLVGRGVFWDERWRRTLAAPAAQR
jgi:hypothetical protein